MDKKIYWILGLLIVAIAVGLIVTASNNQGQAGLLPQLNKPVPASIIAKLNVSESVSNKIGVGGVLYFPQKITPAIAPLTNGTKPEILYIGAEYCPFCAVTRWGMIIALSRFGTFSNLEYMASNESDVYPNTPTFTFVNATYTSNYISFVSVETTTRNHANTLQTPTQSQGRTFDLLNPSGGIPFIDFANQSLQLDAPILPSVLQGQNWNSTIANLTNTNSSISQNLVGSADVFTAEICMITNETPQNVCGQPYVATIQ